MPSNLRVIKMVVACTNASGDPDFFFVKVQCTEDAINDGDHYVAATKYAVHEGYEGPFVCFDEDEAPDWLLGRFVWESASVVNIIGDELTPAPDDPVDPLDRKLLPVEERHYMWKEYKPTGRDDPEPRLLTPWSDPHEHESPMDWCFNDELEALRAKAEHAPKEDWVLCLVTLQPVGLAHGVLDEDEPVEDGGPWSIMYTRDGEIRKSGPYRSHDVAMATARQMQENGEFDVRDQTVYLLDPKHGVSKFSMSCLLADEPRTIPADSDTINGQDSIELADQAEQFRKFTPPLDNIENEDDLP